MINKCFLWDKCNGVLEARDIQYVEEKLRVKFSKSYLDLVKECDGGIPQKSDFTYMDVFNNRLATNCIGRFLSLKHSNAGSLLEDNLSPPEFFPEGLIAFADTGGGAFICFDYRGDKENLDPPIVLWRHGADIGKDISFIAKNFDAFIEMLEEPEED